MRRFACFSRNPSPPPPDEKTIDPPMKPDDARLLTEQSVSFTPTSSMGPDSPFDEVQINRAIHVFLVSQTNVHSIPDTAPALELLSIHSRGVTMAGFNANLRKRCVIRVSRRGQKLKGSITAKDVSGQHQSAERIWLFGRFMTKQLQQDIRGVVPFLSPPKLFRKQYLIEQYAEIAPPACSKDPRMDLHGFISASTDANARQGFSYLYDVICGIREMHRHGWAHLDLSLENVVVSDDHAYIIDFESVLPFRTEELGCLRRRDLRVPLKGPFVPPEHFEASGDDLLSLPSYDVWAFGIMFFTVLFREYLFASRELCDDRNGRKRLVPDREQIDFFLENGFEKFVEKYHKKKHTLLFHASDARFKSDGKKIQKLDERTSSYLHSCGDLLSGIFCRPCHVAVSKSKDGSIQIDHHLDDAAAATVPASQMIYFCDCRRFTAEDIYNHSFWDDNHIRS